MEESHKSHGREYFPWLPFILSAAGDVFLCCVTSHSQPLCPLVLCSTACVSMWFRANFRRTDLFVKWHAAWRPAMFHSCSLLKQERVFQRYLDTLAFSLNWLKDTCDGSMAMAWFYNVYVFAGAQVPKYTGLCCLLGVDHVARKELQKQRETLLLCEHDKAQCLLQSMFILQMYQFRGTAMYSSKMLIFEWTFSEDGTYTVCICWRPVHLTSWWWQADCWPLAYLMSCKWKVKWTLSLPQVWMLLSGQQSELACTLVLRSSSSMRQVNKTQNKRIYIIVLFLVKAQEWNQVQF